MLARTHNQMAPWTLVLANNKRLARLNIIKDLLGRLHYTDKDERLTHRTRKSFSHMTSRTLKTVSLQSDRTCSETLCGSRNIRCHANG